MTLTEKQLADAWQDICLAWNGYLPEHNINPDLAWELLRRKSDGELMAMADGFTPEIKPDLDTLRYMRESPVTMGECYEIAEEENDDEGNWEVTSE